MKKTEYFGALSHGWRKQTMHETTPILEANNLGKYYPIMNNYFHRTQLKALDGVSFSLSKGKTLGIVGESGCGKSTLAKLLMGIETPSFGEIKIDGENESMISAEKRRRKIQMIFQDPYSSLNPRKKTYQIIAEPLIVNKIMEMKEAKKHVERMMETVGLRSEYMERYPSMFSGGQRQRISIARALMLRPEILICDEPVSALDVSVQAQVMNLFIELQNTYQLSYIFISHDLSIVHHLADEVLVMYLGKVVEMGSREQIFNDPLHPYTKALLASSPSIPRKAPPLRGELPSPLHPPKGCSFHKRCPQAQEKCAQVAPQLKLYGEQKVACHLMDK